jgi:hypothetical protein
MALWSNTDEATSAPKHTVNTTNGETGVEAYGKTPVGTFGVDTAETNNTHAGWVLRTVGSGGRSGRVLQETLVAMGSISGDGDALPPLPVITIDTQPQNQSVAVDETATFTVVATASGISTLSYQWQANTGTWTNISGATSASYTTDPAVLGDDGKTFRVIVSGTNGAESVTSSVVTLTVS